MSLPGKAPHPDAGRRLLIGNTCAELYVCGPELRTLAFGAVGARRTSDPFGSFGGRGRVTVNRMVRIPAPTVHGRSTALTDEPFGSLVAGRSRRPEPARAVVS